MTDIKRPFTNPLALAILVLLYERPMHPYEMATTLRERRKESSIRLNYGALYAVIEQLLREKFIAVREILKEGKHPAKTVYELRSLGEVELIDWMRELVSSPVKEFPMFEAAISLLAGPASGGSDRAFGNSHRPSGKDHRPDRRGRAQMPRHEAAAPVFA